MSAYIIRSGNEKQERKRGKNVKEKVNRFKFTQKGHNKGKKCA
jgi:hypothetical protein